MLLIEERRLETPLLYLSGYLESHRREYYDRLQGVRERGAIQEWLQFFLTAVKRQAGDTCQRATALIGVRERYLAESMGRRSSAPRLVTIMLSNPFLRVRRVEQALALTNQGARNVIRDAEKRGWLVDIGSHGRGGRAYWVAKDVVDIVEAPTVERWSRSRALRLAPGSG